MRFSPIKKKLNIMLYNKVEAKDIEFFESVVGKRFVSANPAICASYTSKSIMGLESQIAEVVVRPRYTNEFGAQTEESR